MDDDVTVTQIKLPDNLGKLTVAHDDPDLDLKLKKFSLLLEKQLKRYALHNYLLATAKKDGKLMIMAVPCSGGGDAENNPSATNNAATNKTNAASIADSLQRVVSNNKPKSARSLTAGLAPTSDGIGFRRGR